jgi:DNA processing protein
MLTHWIWLSTRQVLSDRARVDLLQHFPDPEEIFHAAAGAFDGMEGISQDAARSLDNKDLTEAEQILAQCRQKRLQILTWQDAGFPRALKSIPDPPVVLYYKGTLPEFDALPMIGVVGTRKASTYGLKNARTLGKEITRHGGIVVSGMAEGIDAMASWGALDAQGTPVGVLGSGIDRIYPRCNWELFRKVEEKGCLISEYPPGVAPNRWQFPKRNRIISGLCCGVLVVEAPEKSGALITARQALDQGRDVYTVPGNIGVESCRGSNALLRDGASAVMCGWDILEVYQHRFPDKIHKNIPEVSEKYEKMAVDNVAASHYSDEDESTAPTDSLEQQLLAFLGPEEQQLDLVIEKLGLPSAQVLSALTLLEVQGLVFTRPGGWVSRN